jgi:hypothetical protein
MSEEKLYPYNTEILYQKRKTLSFTDFEITYKYFIEKNFKMAGVVRSSSRQVFDIVFTNDSGEREKITREYSYGFPGDLSDGIGFAVTRRTFFLINIWGVSDEGGSLKVCPSTVVYEQSNDKGEFVIRKTAELGLEADLERNTVLAYPDFDLSISTIVKHSVTLSESEKKAAIERAYAYYTENNISIPDDYLKLLEGPEPMETLHITFTFRLTNGIDNVTSEICWPLKGEVEFQNQKYVIELTSIPTFQPKTEVLNKQRIVVRRK